MREIVAWHFHPDNGTPFWLEKAKTLGFDPRKAIQCFDDLKKFGLFEDDWLRGGPVRRCVPKALHKKPIYVFETGGTTGIPKSRVVVEDHWIDGGLGDAVLEALAVGGQRILSEAASAGQSSRSWPEEQALMQQLFDAVALEGAMLVVYHTDTDIRVLRKVEGEGELEDPRAHVHRP